MIRIGTSGWVYDHWKGPFYPADAPGDELFEHYAERFDTVEINNSFYQLPAAKTVAAWHAQAPADFRYAVKANRYITHMKNLLEPEQHVKTMFDRMDALADHLGPYLFQLPPGWHVNVERLRHFGEALPSRHRYAFEFRHASWYSDAVFDLLAAHDCAFCIHDHADAPSPERITADFVYLRFHGREGTYAGSYTAEALEIWAEKIAAWDAAGHDVYAYFNNDAHGYAVDNATDLQERIAARS